MISEDPRALVNALSELTAEELYVLIGRDNGYTETQLAGLIGFPFGTTYYDRTKINTIYERARRKLRRSLVAWHHDRFAA